MIQSFRKRPVVIDAVKYDGSNVDELGAWGVHVRLIDGNSIIVGTLEDGDSAQVEHVASVGDYIIRGVAGEFYPCKPEIFHTTYEPLDAAVWIGDPK